MSDRVPFAEIDISTMIDQLNTEFDETRRTLATISEDRSSHQIYAPIYICRHSAADRCPGRGPRDTEEPLCPYSELPRRKHGTKNHAQKQERERKQLYHGPITRAQSPHSPDRTPKLYIDRGKVIGNEELRLEVFDYEGPDRSWIESSLWDCGILLKNKTKMAHDKATSGKFRPVDGHKRRRYS